MDRRRILLLISTLVAIVGAALVFVYVRAADTRAAQKFEMVSVLGAGEQLNTGEKYDDALAAGRIVFQEVPSGQVLDSAVTDPEALKGTVILQDVFVGEQLIQAKFGNASDVQAAADTGLSIPEGKIAVSVQLADPDRVAGFVNPGSEVAVFVTGKLKGEDELATEDIDITGLLLERVRVLGVGNEGQVSTTTTTDENGQEVTEEIPKTLLTLAVDQKQGQKLILASRTLTLTFGLLTDDSEVETSTPPVTDLDLLVN